MADNMGGISNAWFIFSQKVVRVVETELSATVVLKSGNDWMPIKPGRYGATVKVDPQDSESGMLYNITVTIQLPKQNLDNNAIEYCKRLNRLTAIMKYQNFDGDIFILGSPSYPLRCRFEILHPSSPGGYSGYKLTVTGKQLSPQLRLQD